MLQHTASKWLFYPRLAMLFSCDIIVQLSFPFPFLNKYSWLWLEEGVSRCIAFWLAGMALTFCAWTRKPGAALQWKRCWMILDYEARCCC